MTALPSRDVTPEEVRSGFDDLCRGRREAACLACEEGAGFRKGVIIIDFYSNFTSCFEHAIHVHEAYRSFSAGLDCYWERRRFGDALPAISCLRVSTIATTAD